MIHYWLKRKRIWSSFLVGVILGLIVLVRPINILFILPIVILFKDQNLSWKAYFKQLFMPFSYIIPVVLGGVLIILPQLIFWKFQTGSILSYSYGEEGFFWLKPHIWDGLFSFRKGWFIYTPLMFFALFGMVRLYKTQRMSFWAIVVFLPPFLYVTFSWWCWWYGGSFGARTLIDILPFMALPLAVLIDWVIERKWRWFILFIPSFFVYVNFFQSWQYERKILHYDSMTREAYGLIFLKEKTSMKFRKSLRKPDYENAVKYGVEKESIPLISDDPLSPAYEKSIQTMIEYIKSDEGWTQSIKEKAESRNLPIDSVYRSTAEWILNQE